MEFVLIFLPFAIGLIFFIVVMIHEPRSLLSGLSAFCMLGGLALSLLLLAFAFSPVIAQHQFLISLLVVLFVGVMMLLLFFPFSMVLFFLIEGIRNIKREGFRPANLFSIGFAILLFGYITIWPLLYSLFSSNTWLMGLYLAISFCGSYFLIVLIIYCFSALLNLIHPVRDKKLDEIVVLGAGLLGDQVTPLLVGRIDAGLKLLACNPKAKLILSGGQGPGETMPEGEAMALYCVNHGADPGRLVIENRSVNTYENLIFSRELFRPGSRRIAIVTTRYHVFRALLLAKNLRIPCKGYGSKTKWYFSLNAMLREFIGYLSMTWKRQLAIMAPGLLFIALLTLISSL